MSSSSTSLIEKLRNKPKAKQKERVRVGIKGAFKIVWSIIDSMLLQNGIN